MSEVPLVEIKFAPLRRISPSGFTALSLCPLRAACLAAGQPPLLPQSPASITGTISHKVLEAAGRVRVDSEADTFGKLWDDISEAEEAKMLTHPLQSRFVPLRQHDPRYEVVRWQTCQRASTIAHRLMAWKETSSAEHPHSHYERKVQSSDGRIAGTIDFVLETPEGTILRDYKTGMIWDKSQIGPGNQRVIKEDYQVQLKLYAALWWTETGTWPSRLELVPLDGDSVEVSFDATECLALLQSAQATLASTNDLIKKALQASPSASKSLATPNPSVCRYCSFRPGCTAYKDTYRTTASTEAATQWPLDVQGQLQKQQLLGNGLLMLQILTKQGSIALIRLAAGVNEIVQDGDWIEIYNLSSKDEGKLFSETDLTMIYSHGASKS